MCRKDIFDQIEDERDYQDAQWGTEFDDRNTANDWVTYITQYASRAGVMNVTPDDFEQAMVKVAALAVAAIETSQRNSGPAARHYDAGKPCPPEAVDQAFTGLRVEDL